MGCGKLVPERLARGANVEAILSREHTSLLAVLQTPITGATIKVPEHAGPLRRRAQDDDGIGEQRARVAVLLQDEFGLPIAKGSVAIDEADLGMMVTHSRSRPWPLLRRRGRRGGTAAGSRGRGRRATTS